MMGLAFLIYIAAVREKDVLRDMRRLLYFTRGRNDV